MLFPGTVTHLCCLVMFITGGQPINRNIQSETGNIMRVMTVRMRNGEPKYSILVIAANIYGCRYISYYVDFVAYRGM